MDPELFNDAFVRFNETIDSDGKKFGGVMPLKVHIDGVWLHILDEEPKGDPAVYSIPSRVVAWVRSKPGTPGWQDRVRARALGS